MTGELLYSVEVASRPLPRGRRWRRRRLRREADHGPLLRHLPALGRERVDAHLLAQLAAAAVGPAHRADAGRAAMKIYIAARYDRRFEMLGVAGVLMRAGHVVTSRWIEGRGDGPELVGRGGSRGCPARRLPGLVHRGASSGREPGRRAAGGTSSSASRSRPASGSASSGRARTSSTYLPQVEVYATITDLVRGLTAAGGSEAMTAWGVAPARGRLRICGTCGATLAFVEAKRPGQTPDAEATGVSRRDPGAPSGRRARCRDAGTFSSGVSRRLPVRPTVAASARGRPSLRALRGADRARGRRRAASRAAPSPAARVADEHQSRS